MIAKEHAEIGGAVVVEMPDIESEGAHREQKNHDEHIGDRGGEIGAEFALEDGDRPVSCECFHSLSRALGIGCGDRPEDIVEAPRFGVEFAHVPVFR